MISREVLRDLFGRHSQLFIYHFMFDPSWEQGCKSCSHFMDTAEGAIVHLAARHTAFAVVSRAPLAKIEPFKKRMAWTFPWLSSFGTTSDQSFIFSSCRLGPPAGLSDTAPRLRGRGQGTRIKGEEPSDQPCTAFMRWAAVNSPAWVTENGGDKMDDNTARYHGYRIDVEYGKIVPSEARSPDLERRTFDELPTACSTFGPFRTSGNLE
jgi:hypothetical protein